MKQVDKILTAQTIITMDAQYQIVRDGAVAIHADQIVAVGPKDQVLGMFSGEELLDFGTDVLMPGIVNAHTHVPMTLLRGLADDLRLDVWLLGYMMPVEREFVTPDFCRLGTQIACAEMIRSGITTFADMYYFEETVAKATADAGLRGVCGQTVLKFPAPDADSYEDSLATARHFIETWKGHPLIVPAVAPHAPYTCTEEILQACTDLALEFDVPIHIHLAETQQEVQDWRDQHDMPVIPWVKKLGMLEAKVIAAHCVHVDDGEIHTLQHSNVGIAHNPSSNLKLASGFAPVIDMLSTGLNVGIGTDGPASNNDLDMFEEMRLAAFIAKTVTNDPTALPARQTVEMATRMGARALHLGDLTGSLEIGKRADIISVRFNTTHNMPHFERDPQAIYARLVYAAKSTDVRDVMVNGEWVMRQGELLTLDEASLMEEAAEYAKRIDHFLIEREDSVLSKLIAIGSAEQEESYEIQIKVRLPDPAIAIEQLNQGLFEIVRQAHYREFDTYFIFPEQDDTRLRFREDEFIDDAGEVYNVRSRLTLTGPAKEREYPNSALLSRSRFIAPAQHSPRFYREYFKPVDEINVYKDRLRWLVRFKDLEFFINIDKIIKPEVKETFLEIKSRTWSRKDAEIKADLISSILQELGLSTATAVLDEYPDYLSQDAGS
ncbi:MAG: amidohydrolase [Anaerolineales bacterium]|nr:MAG: amidohydrolase [Anaerolineales bacterium]